MPIIISYFTLNTPYENIMNENLLPSLKKWNLSYDIQSIEDKGNWQSNTGFKSTFILQMLQKHKCSVVFLDADAQVLQYPKLFEGISEDYDLGVHFLDWSWRWRKVKGNSKRHLLSGTMYIPYKSKTIQLIQEFIEEVKQNPLMWEQKAMELVIKKRKDLKIYNLPYSYIVFPQQNGDFPEHMLKKEEAVIWHGQKSRLYKNRHSIAWQKWKGKKC